MNKTVNNLGEAISVLIQVAQLAQSKGVLSFDDATITKSAIDFVNELAKTQENPNQSEVAEVTE